MKTKIALVTASLLVSCLQGLQIYNINLDAPASDRFIEPVRDMRAYVKTVYEQYLFNFEHAWKITDMYMDLIDYGIWWQERDRYLEMDGIARELDLPTKHVVLVSYIFEFVTYCTSLVAKQTDGTLMHLRILDFGPAEALKNITYIASFKKSGREVF